MSVVQVLWCAQMGESTGGVVVIGVGIQKMPWHKCAAFHGHVIGTLNLCARQHDEYKVYLMHTTNEVDHNGTFWTPDWKRVILPGQPIPMCDFYSRCTTICYQQNVKTLFIDGDFMLGEYCNIQSICLTK